MIGNSLGGVIWRTEYSIGYLILGAELSPAISSLQRTVARRLARKEAGSCESIR